jgi:hypothetical protein
MALEAIINQPHFNRVILEEYAEGVYVLVFKPGEEWPCRDHLQDNWVNDGLPTTLSDTPIGTVVGPGDMTWAYQWDVVINPGDTFQISKDKNLSAIPVPEPASGLLVTIAAGMLLVGYRRGKVR